MSDIVLGNLIVFISLIFIYFYFKIRKKDDDFWSLSMKLKALLAGLGFIAVGFILIVKGCNSL